MKKFKINIPLDYVQGHLRNGHGEILVEAESEEEIREKIKNKEIDLYDFGLIVDDYEVDDYGIGSLEDIENMEVN